MNILLTGGTGFVGQALVAALLEDGHDLSVLSRRHDAPTGWTSSVKMIHWTGAPAPIPGEATDGIDAVINLAGESIGSGRWNEKRKNVLFQSRIATTRSLVAAMTERESPPAVFISASAVGYYGSFDNGDREFTEAAPPGDDFLAVLCSHWEDEAKKIIRSGTRLALLRIGVVLERDGGALPRMLLPFRLGFGGPVGSGNQVISWIHRDDLIGLIRYVLASERLSGPINAAAPHPVTSREFAKIAGGVLRRPSFMPTPAFALRLALGEMADLVLKGQRVVPSRALESGFEFQYPEMAGALQAIFRRTPA